MKFTYTDSALIITADESDRANLRELSEAYSEEGRNHWTDQDESEVLESLIANSELDWINPGATGDLTDAPMLGIYGKEIPGCETEGLNPQPLGWIPSGQSNGVKYFQPILKRWAFMDYAVRSFLSDLMDKGEAVFTA